MSSVNVTTLIEDLKVHASLILEFLHNHKALNGNQSESKEHSHKIPNFFKTLEDLGEVIHSMDLSQKFDCTGKIKYRGDKTLLISLNATEKMLQSVQSMSPSWQWPVRFTWRLELIREVTKESFLLAEGCLDFTRSKQGCPSEGERQGRVSQPEDGICVDVNKIHTSGFVSPEDSVTMKWTAGVEPFLQSRVVDEYEQVLMNSQAMFGLYKSPGDALGHLRQEMDVVLQTMSDVQNNESEQGDDIINLQEKLVDIGDKLNDAEEKDENFEQMLVSLKSITEFVLETAK